MFQAFRRVFTMRGVAAALAPAIVATGAHAAGDVAAGKIKIETCKGCHASPGYKNAVPNYSVPKLRGQKVEYLILALKAFRSGERAHPTMRSQAASLSDQDIEDIAAYIGSLSE